MRRANMRLVTVGGRPRILPNEEPVVQQIIQGLALHKIPIYRARERIPGAGAPSEAGIPDLFGWIPPKIGIPCTPLFIEVKRPGRHEKRPAQVAFIARAQHDGAIAFFASGWDDVAKELAIFGIHVAK